MSSQPPPDAQQSESAEFPCTCNPGPDGRHHKACGWEYMDLPQDSDDA